MTPAARARELFAQGFPPDAIEVMCSMSRQAVRSALAKTKPRGRPRSAKRCQTCGQPLRSAANSGASGGT